MRTLILVLAAALAPAVQGAPLEPVWALAQKEKPAAIETLRELVNIESGSRDKEGLDRLAAHLGERLGALGGKVEFYEPGAADTYRLFDTPKDIGKVVVGRFQGSGARRIMLIAHMDTVYPGGTLARRPGDADGARQVRACGREPGARAERDRRARAPDPADERPVGRGEPHQVQLDARERRPDAQRHPGARHRLGGRARQPHRRFRRHR